MCDSPDSNQHPTPLKNQYPENVSRGPIAGFITVISAAKSAEPTAFLSGKPQSVGMSFLSDRSKYLHLHRSSGPTHREAFAIHRFSAPRTAHQPAQRALKRRRWACGPPSNAIRNRIGREIEPDVDRGRSTTADPVGKSATNRVETSGTSINRPPPMNPVVALVQSGGSLVPKHTGLASVAPYHRKIEPVYDTKDQGIETASSVERRREDARGANSMLKSVKDVSCFPTPRPDVPESRPPGSGKNGMR